MSVTTINSPDRLDTIPGAAAENTSFRPLAYAADLGQRAVGLATDFLSEMGGQRRDTRAVLSVCAALGGTLAVGTEASFAANRAGGHLDIPAFAANQGGKYANAPSSGSEAARSRVARIKKDCLPDPLYVAQNGKRHDTNKYRASMRVVNLDRRGKVVPGRISPGKVAKAPRGTYRQRFQWAHPSNLKVCAIEATRNVFKQGMSLFDSNRTFFPKPDRATKSKGFWVDAWSRGTDETESLRLYLKRR